MIERFNEVAGVPDVLNTSFNLRVETIVTTVLSFETNVLLLTLIGSDLVITNLERARGLSTGTANHLEDSNRKLSAFVGQED